MTANGRVAGTVASLWRYPVKSMRGEELAVTEITGRGLVGDRAYALVEPAGGLVVSAKNPRKWPGLLEFSAAFIESRLDHHGPVRITLPNGRVVMSDDDDLDRILSSAFGREVNVRTDAPEQPALEEYWPDMEGLDHRETVTVESIHKESFFDAAPVHLLTTATLNHLHEIYPEGRFEVSRFRPNLVVETNGAAGFVENDWMGLTVAIGDEVRLQVVRPCARCVMTTLPQNDLPKDPGILRAAAKHNGAVVGVYANVVQGGTVRPGDTVLLQEQ